MYYRRKVLLALLEVFGGSLKRTDCLKLLFLFSQNSKRNVYDFFPYKYGCFSFQAYQDKGRLEELGLLSKQYGFKKKTDQSFVETLDDGDRQILFSLSDRFDGKLGKKLVREVYLQYPHFASRSTILQDVLDPDETVQIADYQIEEEPCLFSIGYEGLSIDAFLNKLISNNILAVLDVRKNPLSMKYGFSKTKLSAFLKKANISYFHLPKLGIPSELRKSLENPEDYSRLFEKYESEILPNQQQSLIEIQSLLDSYTRVALLCFESNAEYCHRHKIIEKLRKSKSFSVKSRHI